MHASPYSLRRGPRSDAYPITATEEAHLATLGDSQVQSWASARIEECQERIRALCSLYNDAAPINRILPDEILMEIFRMLRPSSSPGEQGLRFLHVCRLWRRLLLNTPEFWVDLLSKPRAYANPMPQRQEDYLRFCLELTGVLPITLDIPAIKGRSPVLAQILTPHRHRIASLKITYICHSDQPFLSALFRDGLPGLESLSVQYESEVTHPELMDFTQGHFPQLRSLRHPFGAFTLGDFGRLLRKLELYRSWYYTPAVIHDMHTTLKDIMTMCTSLECLILDDVLPRVRTGPSDLWHWELPSTLRTLQIIESCATSLSYFLPRITYPLSCFVDIFCYDMLTFAGGLLWGDGEPYRRLCVADKIQLSSTLSDPNGGFFWVPGVIEVRMGGAQTYRGKLQHQEQTTPSLLADFAKLFGQPFPNVTSFRLDLDASSLCAEDDVRDSLRAILTAFLNLVHLDVTGCDGRRDIIPLLEESTGGPAGPGACICPRLEELRVDWSSAYDLSSPGWENQDGSDEFAWFCDVVERMLECRRIAGVPLRRLIIGVAFGWDRNDLDDEQWDPSVLVQRFRSLLGHLVEVVSVVTVAAM